MDNNMYIYELNGDGFNENEYRKMRKNLKANDVLVFKSLDSIGRTYEEIQAELIYITKKIKADIVVLDMPLLDTRVNKEINGTLISDIVIQLLSYTSNVEKNYRKQRQAEGIAEAKATGTKFGRPPTPYPNGFDEVYAKIMKKEINMTKGAEILGIKFHAIRRHIERKSRELELE